MKRLVTYREGRGAGQRLRRKAAQVIKQIQRHDQASLRTTAKAVDEVRKEVRRSIQEAGEFTTFHLRAIEGSLDEALAGFRELYPAEMRQLMDEGFRLGVDKVDEPLRAARVAVELPTLTLEQVSAAALVPEHFVGLVSGLADEARRKVMSEVRLGAMGAKTPLEVMKGIDAAFGRTGGPRGFTFRAETIARTELKRVQSFASNARLEAAREVVGELEREWVWSGVSRVEHALADGQTRKVGEPFDVGGEQLMFPRDPAGSPENTILCGCDEIPFIRGISEERPGLTSSEARDIIEEGGRPVPLAA